MPSQRGKSTRRRKQRGGGYSEVLSAKDMINPGNQVHQAYPGPLKDCAGSPTRPGTMADIGSLRVPGGLPGVSSMVGVATPPVVAGPAGLVSNWFGPSWIGKGGGSRKRKGRKGGKKQRKQQGGATQLGSGGVVTGLSSTPMTNMGAVAATMKTQTIPATPATQKGGRYGFFPGDGPLNAVNGVGATGVAPFARIGCEVGTFNALNPNPRGIQTMSTLPFPPTPPGLTPMRGGYVDRLAPATVSVGDVDAMRYYAPNAGYSNLPMAPQVQNNPGILMQVGYPAGHFNQACLKAGGGRKSRRRTQRRRSARRQQKKD